MTRSLIRTLSFVAALCIVASCAGQDAHQEPGDRCAPGRIWADHLEQQHGQRVIASGLSRRGYLLQVYATTEGTAFTVLLTTPAASCLVGDGKDWRVLRRAVPKGDDA